MLHYDDGHVRHMLVEWLSAHRPGQRAQDPAAIAPRLWRRDQIETALPRHAAARIVTDGHALNAGMQETATYGIAIVDHLKDRTSAGACWRAISAARPQRSGSPRPNALGEIALSTQSILPIGPFRTVWARPLRSDAAPSAPLPMSRGEVCAGSSGRLFLLVDLAQGALCDQLWHLVPFDERREDGAAKARRAERFG